MPAVFVHGNPETDAIWVDLFAALDRTDLIALSPPGFGAPVPDGWGGTRLDYLAWLVAELETIAAAGEPIDLVGHDWGGGHVLGVALERPDLVRSWCVDLMGIAHPDYVWHDAAQGWISDEGEEIVAAMTAVSAADRIAMYESLGISSAAAASMADAANDDMARCILSLYRSAAQPALVELGAGIEAAAAKPGLVIIAEQDHYVGTAAMSEEMSARAGASVVHLSGVGHWWMTQDPAAGAAALDDFWAGLGA